MESQTQDQNLNRLMRGKIDLSGCLDTLHGKSIRVVPGL